jgi:hypothetical protein
MKISLTTDCYVLLLTNVPQDTEAFAALTKATKDDGRNPVDEFYLDCSEVDGEMFLAAAEEFFPERIRELERAVERAVR